MVPGVEEAVVVHVLLVVRPLVVLVGPQVPDGVLLNGAGQLSGALAEFDRAQGVETAGVEDALVLERVSIG